MVLLEPPPYRVPQPSRPGQPAARVGPFQLSSPAPASTRKKVVATASRRKTTASNNLDPLSRARPWSALPRCCVNIAVRVAPTEQASRASLFSERSRDGMSKAPAIYCRGRAGGVRGDEATYLSMTVRHGCGASGHWPFLPLPAFSSSASLLPPLAALGSAVSPAPCAGLPTWEK